MRIEEEMINQILNIANNDSRIMAVYMNGSRTNKNVPRDIFQDYDIVYVVKETKSFIEDKNWINKFGEIAYMQYPDEHPDFPSDKDNFYGWLMQFSDGNRIDLHVETVVHAKEHILDDKLCKILLDKDNILPKMPEATDQQYWVKKPTIEQFLACYNEFWWCSNNLAKGLWRGEITYVQDMANFVVRKQLEKMLSWKIGVLTDFSVSVGKSGKYMYKWLDEIEYEEYLRTYFTGSIKEAWKSIFIMCDLFAEVTNWTANKLGYDYNEEEGEAAFNYLRKVRELPKDTKEI